MHAIVVNVLSSSLKGGGSAEHMYWGGGVKPVKVKEKPRLALEARLSAAPALLTRSSLSSFSCTLRDLRMWLWLWPPPPTDADRRFVLPKLDLRDRLAAEVSAGVLCTVSPDAVRLSDCDGATSWSDLVRPIIPSPPAPPATTASTVVGFSCIDSIIDQLRTYRGCYVRA